MDEKKIIEQLNESTKDIHVPEKLLPENIMNTISDSKKKKKVISFEKIRRGVTARKMAGLVSAAAILIVAVFAYQGITGKQNNTINSDMARVDNSESLSMEQEESLVIAQTGNVSGYDEVYEEFAKYKTPEPNWFVKLFDGSNKKNVAYGVLENEMITSETWAASDTATTTQGMMGTMESAPEEAGGDAGYSKTNVQTVGIDEADIIKTDGKYIYYASSDMHTVTIYSVDGEKTEKITNLYIEGLGSLSEIYVDGDTLLATGSSYRDDKYHVTLVKYNITDRKNPEYVGAFSQEGESIETRKIGDIVYVVTEVYSDVNNIKKSDPKTFIPFVCDNLIAPEDIYIPEESEGTVYTVISSVDITEDMKKIDSAAVLGFNGTFYMGNENMYLYRTSYDSGMNGGNRVTDIRKIDYVSGNGLIGAISEGKVPGVVKDTFAVNEYNGYLRMMTTSYPSNGGSVNNVFVLDKDLNVAGSIEGLAQGERIYSARYMGDTAYFVTYRETDPLYSVDLSDPQNPKIMGALKIPGFSEYLHAYGDGRLLGIGIEQMENKNGWNQDYIKLSMFDITDPYDVTEEDKMILNDATYSPALYDYKMVMIDPQKNLFGFVTEDYYNSTGASCTYRVYTYTNAGFVELVSFDLNDSNIYGTRSVYIGDYVYIVNEEGIWVFSIR
ncbi:MAG: beta-propeller domain-containing protein [Thermoflexaceae bacterium]|nr:beta-propeller domain-containing protein [Thermoflexaceae bacterium]